MVVARIEESNLWKHGSGGEIVCSWVYIWSLLGVWPLFSIVPWDDHPIESEQCMGS